MTRISESGFITRKMTLIITGDR